MHTNIIPWVWPTFQVKPRTWLSIFWSMLSELIFYHAGQIARRTFQDACAKILLDKELLYQLNMKHQESAENGHESSCTSTSCRMTSCTMPGTVICNPIAVKKPLHPLYMLQKQTANWHMAHGFMPQRLRYVREQVQSEMLIGNLYGRALTSCPGGNNQSPSCRGDYMYVQDTNNPQSWQTWSLAGDPWPLNSSSPCKSQ